MVCAFSTIVSSSLFLWKPDENLKNFKSIMSLQRAFVFLNYREYTAGLYVAQFLYQTLRNKELACGLLSPAWEPAQLSAVVWPWCREWGFSQSHTSEMHEPYHRAAFCPARSGWSTPAHTNELSAWVSFFSAWLMLVLPPLFQLK